MDHLVSEVTPLLQSVKRIPWFQLSILFFLQAVEPLTSQVTSPLALELSRADGNESQVGYYGTLLQSACYFTQAGTVLHWSKTSDRIGRKPVILIGLVGSSLSMLCFGLSQSIWGLALSRCINGALNANTAVIKSMMAEMVDPADLVRVYAFMPLAWSAGATLGPMIGMYFSRPAGQPPESDVVHKFDSMQFFPNLLPASVPMLLNIIAWLVTSYFLKETVKSTLPVSTILASPSLEDGPALGDAVVSSVGSRLPLDPHAILSKSAQTLDSSLPITAIPPFPKREDGPALGDAVISSAASRSPLDPRAVLSQSAQTLGSSLLVSAIPPSAKREDNPALSHAATSPLGSQLPLDTRAILSQGAQSVNSALPVPTILSPPKSQDVLARGNVVVSGVASRLPVDPLTFLSLRTLLTPRLIIVVVNYALLSLLDSTFRAIQRLFLANPVAAGGLGMDPAMIAKIFADSRLLGLEEHLHGFLARIQGFGILLWIAVGIQTILPIAFSLSFGAIFMYITAAAPNPESLGATNGLSQMLASTMSGLGAGFASGLFSPSEQGNYLHGYSVYYVLVTIAAVAVVIAKGLPRTLYGTVEEYLTGTVWYGIRLL
ncbi:putative MFS general substrate transporter [Lyophyllum shimeji]|uniref:MFS general substrate transporter n=1 Tax=Lyophyllum shimeji TaxID=47721 RepID=A0A9P3UTS2_LYOSH|nr:putative MFS general substrate transporter [Lyophyllum shimeji]